MVTRRLLASLSVPIALAGCSASPDDFVATPSATAVYEPVEAAGLAFELPPECDGWSHLGDAELPDNFLYIEYDHRIVDLKADHAGDCMPAVMRSLADDPPAEPLTIRIGGPQSQPSTRTALMEAALRALRPPAAACSTERELVRLDLSVEPEHGRVDAKVHNPNDTPQEQCIVDAARGLQLGATGSDALSSFTFVLPLGPTPPSLGDPDLSLEDKRARSEAIRKFFAEVRRDLAHCSDTPQFVEFQIAFEGNDGTVVQTRLVAPKDHPSASCIDEALVGRSLGPLEDPRRGGARYVTQIGPRPGSGQPR